jgi:hypothetical protein
MLELLRQWLSQDVARDNAARAAGRLLDIRQERDAVDDYLAQRLNLLAHLGEPAQRPRPQAR